MSQSFVPSYYAALARIAAIEPQAYASTRNALDGAVTGLSPYLTHGVVSVSDVVCGIAAHHCLGYHDKIVFELAWREFFLHVWERAAASGQPDALLADMRPAAVWPGHYSHALPDDIRQGATGVPAIDAAVRQLYASGYLHNHARMWLASYCVHLRKVHWRAGADWLVGHLLDGDLASNHLSWQWVAATFSSKPYLFNAGNIVKYAPPADWKTWHSPRTVVDTSYEALDYIARHDPDIGAEKGQHMAVTEPVMLTAALGSFIEHFFKKNSANVAVTSSYIAINYVANLASSESIELVHPWALGQRKPQHDAARADVWRVGIIDLAAHQAQPWGALRWRWVLARMADIVDSVWVGDLAQLRAQQLAYAVGSMQSTTLTNTLPIHSSATLYARYRDWLPQMGAVRPKAHFFAAPAKTCSSFSQFYEGTKKIQPNFSSLLTA